MFSRALPTTHDPGAEPAAVPGTTSQRLGGSVSLSSSTYNCQPVCNCFKLFKHDVCSACCLARAKAGNSSTASIAMMAMTTSSSINVNARAPALFFEKPVMQNFPDTPSNHGGQPMASFTAEYSG